jgi:hypothetical protein
VTNNKKLCSEFLYQCFVTEMTGKVPSLMEWSRFKQNLGGSTDTIPFVLPKIEDNEEFLTFIRGTMRNEIKDLKMNDWYHGQYKSDPTLESYPQFSRVLKEISKYSTLFIDNLCDEYNSGNGHRVGSRSLSIEKLALEISGFCGSKVTDDIRFMCSQVICDMEELICNHPFGEVTSVTVGHGGKEGYGLVTLGNTVTRLAKPEEKEDMASFLLSLVEVVTSQDESGLMLMGLYKTEDGSVCSRYNQREFSVVDAEHLLCKIYIVYERVRGGSRSSSKNPRSWFSHCHPMFGYTSTRLSEISTDILLLFQLLVDNNMWKKCFDLGGVNSDEDTAERTVLKLNNPLSKKIGGLPPLHDRSVSDVLLVDVEQGNEKNISAVGKRKDRETELQEPKSKR